MAVPLIEKFAAQPLLPHSFLTHIQTSTILCHHHTKRAEILYIGEGMLQRGIALAVITALSLILAACGGEASETTASAQTASSTPQVEPTPTQAASATPKVEPTPAEDASGDAASGNTVDVAEHLSEKTMQMWEVYNKHDLDALKAFYEENYWKEQEDEIRSNMQPFKTFGISITGEETSPPTEIAPGKWEIRHIGRFPLGSVDMVLIYEEFEGAWLLTYAESQ